MRYAPSWLFLLLGTTLLFVLPACDSSGDDGPGDLDSGEHRATLSGDLSGSISGNAFFSIIDDPDAPSGRAFVLLLFDGNAPTLSSTGEFIAFVRLGDRPSTGSYMIEEDPEGGGVAATYIDFQSQTSGVSLAGQSGSLSITASSSDRVAGTFEFSGTGFAFSNFQDEITGSISGSFDAEYLNSAQVPTGDL